MQVGSLSSNREDGMILNRSFPLTRSDILSTDRTCKVKGRRGAVVRSASKDSIVNLTSLFGSV